MPLHTKRGQLTFRTWIACGFGTGFAPIAPGTIATFFLAVVYGFLPYLDPVLSGLCVAAICILGVYLTGHAERFLGHDAGSIVWDEYAGFAVTVWYIPKTWEVVIGAFILFRIFDVLKPPPIRAAEKLPAGWGIMADDVLAGIYANLALRALITVITHW
jgi:phosphatidylglycerophosphatase A